MLFQNTCEKSHHVYLMRKIFGIYRCHSDVHIIFVVICYVPCALSLHTVIDMLSCFLKSHKNIERNARYTVCPKYRCLFNNGIKIFCLIKKSLGLNRTPADLDFKSKVVETQ